MSKKYDNDVEVNKIVCCLPEIKEKTLNADQIKTHKESQDKRLLEV